MLHLLFYSIVTSQVSFFMENLRPLIILRKQRKETFGLRTTLHSTPYIAALPITKIYYYKMDYKGQELAEFLFSWIIIAFGAVGWVVGYFHQDFSYTFYAWLAGVVLACIVSTSFILFLFCFTAYIYFLINKPYFSNLTFGCFAYNILHHYSSSVYQIGHSTTVIL